MLRTFGPNLKYDVEVESDIPSQSGVFYSKKGKKIFSNIWKELGLGNEFTNSLTNEHSNDNVLKEKIRDYMHYYLQKRSELLRTRVKQSSQSQVFMHQNIKTFHISQVPDSIKEKCQLKITDESKKRFNREEKRVRDMLYNGHFKMTKETQNYLPESIKSMNAFVKKVEKLIRLYDLIKQDPVFYDESVEYGFNTKINKKNSNLSTSNQNKNVSNKIFEKNNQMRKLMPESASLGFYDFSQSPAQTERDELSNISFNSDSGVISAYFDPIKSISDSYKDENSSIIDKKLEKSSKKIEHDVDITSDYICPLLENALKDKETINYGECETVIKLYKRKRVASYIYFNKK